MECCGWARFNVAQVFAIARQPSEGEGSQFQPLFTTPLELPLELSEIGQKNLKERGSTGPVLHIQIYLTPAIVFINIICNW